MPLTGYREFIDAILLPYSTDGVGGYAQRTYAVRLLREERLRGPSDEKSTRRRGIARGVVEPASNPSIVGCGSHMKYRKSYGRLDRGPNRLTMPARMEA